MVKRNSSWKLFSMSILIAAALVAGSAHADVKTKFLAASEVTKTMLEFNKALGVKCDFCHVADRSKTYKDLAGKPVDAKELSHLVHQRIARAMLGTMLYLNKKEGTKLTCNSCHQGKADVKVK